MFQSISTTNTTPLANPEHLKHYYDLRAVYFGIRMYMYVHFPLNNTLYSWWRTEDIRSRMDSHERP